MTQEINQQKAREIARGLNFASDYPHDYKSVYDGAILMAQCKDEQEIEFLQSLVFQASTPKALNIIINNRIKLLKGE